MEMIVVELKPHNRVTDLKLNQYYLGKIISDNFVALNSSIKGKLQKPTSLNKGEQVAVKVNKINLPYIVELELVPGAYEVANDSLDQGFLIKLETLNKLQPKLQKGVELIKDAISCSRPIIIRHHADCDGYVGAIAIEKALTPLIAAKHRSSIWHHYRRSPSRAPYYDYGDALKDISTYLNEVKNKKPPLLIYVDSGSTKQDILAFKRVKQYGFDIIVLDHHKPTIKGDNPVVEGCVDLLINPHLAGGDNTLVAGMLGCELARLLNKRVELEHLPAIAGVADKSKGKALEGYVALAKKRGYSEQLIFELGQCIDFEIFYLGRFGSDLIEDILFSDIEQQKRFVNLVKEQINKSRVATLSSAEKYSEHKRLGEIQLVKLELSKIFGFGEYPPSGKATGMVFDSLNEKLHKLIVLGIGEDYITIRTNAQGFDLNTMIEKMRAKLAHAQIEGGGHEVAGTVKFIQAAKQEVLNFIEAYLSEKYGSN